MTIEKRRFHNHERRMGDEDFHFLARDTDTGRVFVIHEWSHRVGDKFGGDGQKEIEVGEFLSGNGSTAKSNLLKLIGTLVPDN